jgi:4-hydroxy-3-polyprenylbenzoate decarboxylase
MTAPHTVTLALTGASGMPYGIRLLETLLGAGKQVYLLYSQAAQIVAKQELALVLPARPREAAAYFTARFKVSEGQLRVFGRDDWFAPVASGSSAADAMVICPCTMGTLAAVASGLADNLIERAADVMLKERRPLVLVPRETPLSSIHLENMLRLSRAGAVILPADPGFYHHPSSVQDLVDFVVARVLDQLCIEHRLMPRWGSDDAREATISAAEPQSTDPSSSS